MPPEKRPLILRLAWMAGIWAASVAALGVAAWVLRLIMRGVGFHS